MRRSRVLLFGAFGLLFLITPRVALTQGAAGVHFGLHGGASVPTGDAGDAFETGWHAGALLTVTPPAIPFGFRIEGMYHKMDIDTDLPLEGDTEIVAGIGSILLGPRTPLVKPYFIGGAGYYRLNFSARSVFGRLNETENEFGWSAGGGVSFGLGKTNLFIEARYHSVSTEGERFTFVPVSVGLVF